MTGGGFDPSARRDRFDAADLTGNILDRTSGRACGRAEDLLGARWDAALDPLDAKLLASHLTDCAPCRELALVLDRLESALPALAEREPGRDFTTRVLRRTSGAPRRLTASAWISRRVEQAVQRARGMWNRPRFALEAAWTAAAIMALLVWSPLAPQERADTATNLVRAGVGAAPEVVDQLQVRAVQLRATVEDLMAMTADEAATRLADLGTRVHRRVGPLLTEIQALRDRLAAGGDGDATSHDSENPRD